MYTKLDKPLHMTTNEATEKYPNSYIFMQHDEGNNYKRPGYVLYVGDDWGELISLQMRLDIPRSIVLEGINLQASLGGFLVGE